VETKRETCESAFSQTRANEFSAPRRAGGTNALKRDWGVTKGRRARRIAVTGGEGSGKKDRQHKKRMKLILPKRQQTKKPTS